MDAQSALVNLTLFTLLGALGFGFYQLNSVKKSQERHNETPGAAPIAKGATSDPDANNSIL